MGTPRYAECQATVGSIGRTAIRQQKKPEERRLVLRTHCGLGALGGGGGGEQRSSTSAWYPRAPLGSVKFSRSGFTYVVELTIGAANPVLV